MDPGKVVTIHLVAEAGGTPFAVDEVKAVAGRGLEGDRYFSGNGTYSEKPGPNRHVTLIEEEAIEAVRSDYSIDLAPGESRRNIMVRGVALNHLVGHEFTVGDATLRGIKLCEPCTHMEELSKPGARKALLHRGGLRCEIVSGGVIRVGDPVKTG
jgi:MOSC domain-containing protein YiiM